MIAVLFVVVFLALLLAAQIRGLVRLGDWR